MKKIFSLILATSMLMALSACGGSNLETTASNNVLRNTNATTEVKTNYNYGDRIRILNVIDVGEKIKGFSSVNRSEVPMVFNVVQEQISKTYDIKGNIIKGYHKNLNGYYIYRDQAIIKYSVKNSKDEVVKEAEYDNAYISDDLLYAIKNSTLYIFDSKMKEIFKRKVYEGDNINSKGLYHDIGPKSYSLEFHLRDGLINLPNEQGKYGYVDINGKVVIDFKYDSGHYFNNGYACVVGKDKQGKYKYGLIDKKGNLIIDFQYDDILNFYNGISMANKDGVGYYININNEKVLNGLLFEATKSFSEELAPVKMNGKWGFIDTNGREAFPCIFDAVSGFGDGIALGAYGNNVVVLTYLDILPFGFTESDVNLAYEKLSSIDNDSAYWANIRKKLEGNVNTKNWSDNEYSDDFNYTLTYKAVQPDSWYVTDAGVWYYFENDRSTKRTGWYKEPKDEQTYYLNPTNGVMATGWTEIEGDMYYFSEDHASTPNWYYIPESDSWESHGKNIKSYGAMYRNETTPDGKKVDSDGKLIE